MNMHRSIKLAVLLSVLLVGGCNTAQETTEGNLGDLPPEALKYNPKAAKINTQLGIGYMNENDMERAKFKLLLAQRQDPNAADVQEALGLYYDKTGNTERAEQFYQQAIASAKESRAQQENNYGVFLCKQKRFSEANKYFVRALNDPKNITTAQTYENAGLCATQVPDEALAEKYFQAALKINNQLSSSLLELAKINYHKAEYMKAQQYLDHFSALSKPTADSLWLGIQLGRKLDNKDVVYSDALLLKHQYPNSKEYKMYLETKAS